VKIADFGLARLIKVKFCSHTNSVRFCCITLQ